MCTTLVHEITSWIAKGDRLSSWVNTDYSVICQTDAIWSFTFHCGVCFQPEMKESVQSQDNPTTRTPTSFLILKSRQIMWEWECYAMIIIFWLYFLSEVQIRYHKLLLFINPSWKADPWYTSVSKSVTNVTFLLRSCSPNRLHSTQLSFGSLFVTFMEIKA